MTSLVADTHAVVWYLFQSSRLSTPAFAALQTSIKDGVPVVVSAITVAEVTYLVEKGRLDRTQLDQLIAGLRRPDFGFRIHPVDLAVVEALARIPRASVPDMPDRIIAATALHLGLPLVTTDRRIHAAGIAVIW